MFDKEIKEITNNSFISLTVPSNSSIVSVCALLSTSVYGISTILHIKNEMTQNNTKEENDNKEPESNAVNVNKVNLSNIKTPEQFRKNNKNTKEKEEFVGEISDADIYITVPESDSDTYAEKSYQYNKQNDFLEDGFSDRLSKVYNNFSL